MKEKWQNQSLKEQIGRATALGNVRHTLSQRQEQEI